MRFERKTAFITGGGGNIGFHTGLALAREGATAVLCDVNGASVDAAVERIRAGGGRAIGVVADITRSSEVNEAVRSVTASCGAIDISVHVAGGSARAQCAPLSEQTDDVLKSVIEINLFGALYCARAVSKQMMERKSGRIISLASIVGTNGLAGCVEYSAAKGGVIAMTRSLAMELGQYGITVNCVSPGIVRRPDETFDAIGTNVLGRNGTADEVAGVIAFLASDEASFITGQNVIIDGGRSLGLKGSR